MFFRLYRTKTEIPYLYLEGGWYDPLRKWEVISFKAIFEDDGNLHLPKILERLIKQLRVKRYIDAYYMDFNYIGGENEDRYDSVIYRLKENKKLKLIKKGGYFTMTSPVF